MELHQVRYFLALAESLNFTRAAEQCNVTQPALTKAVQKLEYELGGELVHRERQLTQLTDLGKLVLPMLERTLAAANAVRLNAREFQRKGIAPLRIGLAPCVSAELLVAPLAEIARFVPGLQVELTEAPAELLLDLLLKGEISAALADDMGGLPDRIDCWRLFEERFVLLVSADNPLAGPHPIPIAALAGLTWLEHIGCEAEKRFWQTYLSQEGELKVVHRGRQDNHLQHMAAAGMGVMLAPEHVPYLPSLVACPIAGDPLKWEVQLLVMAGRRYSPALDAFVKVARLRDWHADIEARRSSYPDLRKEEPDERADRVAVEDRVNT